ncbi:MAG: hypothetical protein ACRC7D_12020 [Aeromonas popoffii]|jgi:hypothetical protein|uniref:hypothetical protein n=1 Tax=Aeromonas popoffii TaxID=70856 RepID=UPI003F330575
MPRGAGSAYLYYLDMSEFKKLLEKMSGEGRYFSLLGVAIVVPEPSHGSGDLTRRLTVTSLASMQQTYHRLREIVGSFRQE